MSKIVKNLIILSIVAFAFIIPSEKAFADGNIEKVIIDNVLWPVDGLEIPKKPDESIRETEPEKYNAQKEAFIKLLDFETDFVIDDAYWMYKPAGVDDSYYVRVPETDTYFSDLYTYKMRVVVSSEGQTNPKPFSVELKDVLAYFDYATASSRGTSDMSYFKTKLYADPDNEIDVNPHKMRFDIGFNDKKEGENPFIELSRVRAVGCTAYGKSDGKLLGVTNRMVVSGNGIDGTVSGSTEDGNTIRNLSAGTFKVASIYDANKFVLLTVTSASAPGTISVDAVDFGSVQCGYTPETKYITIKNTSSVPVKITNVLPTGKDASDIFAVTSTLPIDLAAGESTGTKVEIKPVAGLHGNSSPYTQDISVEFTYDVIDGSTTTTMTGTSKATASMTVLHVYDYKQGGWCTVCDEYKEDFTPRIISGSGRTYYQNFWPQFTVNLMYEHFDAVLVDGNVIVNGTDYAVAKDGYTKFTIQNSYLKSLKTGKHTIEFVFKDKDGNKHTASGYFRVSSATAAYTGDDTSMQRGIVLAILSLLGIWMTIFYSLKRRFRHN